MNRLSPLQESRPAIKPTSQIQIVSHPMQKRSDENFSPADPIRISSRRLIAPTKTEAEKPAREGSPLPPLIVATFYRSRQRFKACQWGQGPCITHVSEQRRHCFRGPPRAPRHVAHRPLVDCRNDRRADRAWHILPSWAVLNAAKLLAVSPPRTQARHHQGFFRGTPDLIH